MIFSTYGDVDRPNLMLLPGLGVSHEIFLPLIEALQNHFHIVAIGIDGFLLGQHSRFTSIDDQAKQAIAYIVENHRGRINVAYGLSLGGKILSRMLELNTIAIDHAVMDAAPLLPLPRWLMNPLRYYQCFNVWTCYRFTWFWKWVFRSHYFDVLLNECRKVYPYGRRQAVLDGYKDVYTNKLEWIANTDIHYWYGSKEAFVARPQIAHLRQINSNVKVEMFQGMNHGQFLVDCPRKVAQMLLDIAADS
ncbi:MAG: hypothetical protein IKI28_09900 [Bacteroidales bacterium]|nr:hypothetical protein [Bacteroidales bacterium]